MAIDPAGFVHIVADLRSRIVDITNESGDWSTIRVAVPPDDTGYGGPTLAIDGDGRMYVAFTTFTAGGDLGPFPDGILLVDGLGNAWSAPTNVAPHATSPSLAVRDGVVHLAFTEALLTDVACEDPLALHYASVVGETVTTSTLYEVGFRPLIALAPDGTTKVVSSDLCGLANPPAMHLSDANGTVVIPGTQKDDALVGFGIDGAGLLHIAFIRASEEDEVSRLFYTSLTPEGWIEPVPLLVGAYDGALAVDARGIVHVVGFGEAGLQYASGEHGNFAVLQLVERISNPYGSVAVAVDAGGRPHVAYNDEAGESDTAVWYTVGPAD